uniref:Globin family profile domain-containing protein n=1 Tax=Astatotilapia calliptera TaxID=8154 RepID=A0AAX7UY79_ASTCA
MPPPHTKAYQIKSYWCIAYSDLTHCVEFLANITSCFFPNPDIQDFFIDIHLKFFQNCTNENDPMTEDAPQKVVIGLTLLSTSAAMHKRLKDNLAEML